MQPSTITNLQAPVLLSQRARLTALAWAVTLFVSLLPDILYKEISGALPAWLFWAKLAIVTALLLSSLVWQALRPLRLFFIVLLAVYSLEWAVLAFFERLNYAAWFVGASAFQAELFAVQIPRASTGLLLVLVMWVCLRRFERFFFVRGDLNARAAPLPLIMSRPTRWTILGPAIAAAMSLGLVVFILAFGSLPSATALRSVLPLLPFVLLFAASNAFGEEMLYRAPWLAALESPLGPAQALLMTAVYFGVGHFYGVPYGVLGVVMAFIPGWLMGKAMLETRGFLWAWLIHICMDIVVFFFMALGSVTPGG